MAEWYLIYGFDSESELNDYKENVKDRRKRDNPMDIYMENLPGENLGVYLINQRELESFDFFNTIRTLDGIEVFPYYVFWKIEAGFSTGYGFYDRKDMQEDDI